MTNQIDNVTPEMTLPLGKHWNQPFRGHISMTDTHATMRRKIFNMLLNYSSSFPSGVYPGKMWKCANGDEWLLCWYGEVPNEPTKCSINTRIILLTEVIELLMPAG